MGSLGQGPLYFHSLVYLDVHIQPVNGEQLVPSSLSQGEAGTK